MHFSQTRYRDLVAPFSGKWGIIATMVMKVVTLSQLRWKRSRTITAVEKGASPYGTRWGRRAQTLHQVDIGVNPLPTLRGGRARTPGVADIVVYPLPS